MKNIKEYNSTLLFTLFAYLFLFSNGCSDYNQGAEFKLYIDNEYCVRGETIWINAEFINKMPRAILLTGEFDEDEGFKIQVKNDNGQELRKGIIVCEIIAFEDTTFYLQPNDTLRTSFNLSWFPVNSKYIKVSSSYNNINSNELKIKIKEPDGIDKEARSLINEFNQKYSEVDSSNFEKDKLLMRVINNYGESRFTPEAYYHLLNCFYYRQDTVSYKETLENYFNKYADNPYSDFIISSYSAFLKIRSMDLSGSFDREQVKKDLEKLSEKYSGNKKLNQLIEKFINKNVTVRIRKLKE